MKKATIKNEYLRELLNEIEINGEDTSDETFKRLMCELKHSCLITAGDMNSNMLNLFTIMTDKGDFGMLFTDMDEFAKVFPDFEVEAHENTFGFYKHLIDSSDLLGFVINFKSEGFVLVREIFDCFRDLPEEHFPTDNGYSSDELKAIMDSIDNRKLEDFIGNPSNIGRYEELFENISNSTLLTLRLSSDDFTSNAEGGVISMRESGPLGFLHKDDLGGDYATVFTSEAKIRSVQTPLNKYSQLVNFSQMVTFLLNSGMDGIIINPSEENVMITREVLMEYYGALQESCNDERMNSAIFHMFVMEE